MLIHCYADSFQAAAIAAAASGMLSFAGMHAFAARFSSSRFDYWDIFAHLFADI